MINNPIKQAKNHFATRSDRATFSRRIVVFGILIVRLITECLRFSIGCGHVNDGASLGTDTGRSFRPIIQSPRV